MNTARARMRRDRESRSHALKHDPVKPDPELANILRAIDSLLAEDLGGFYLSAPYDTGLGRVRDYCREYGNDDR